MTDEPIRLNIGAGDSNLPGYLPIDRKHGTEAVPLDYPDNSVDAIYASHILEHFGHRDTVHVLREWVRALKPGGELKLAVPDVDKAYALRAQGDPRFESYLMGGQAHEDDWHGTLFDEHTLRQGLREVGLRQIMPWKSEIGDCASLPVSLNLRGVKRGPVDVSGVIPIMTAPRLGFTDHYRVAQRAFTALRMQDPDVTGGALWNQGLTNAIETALSRNPRYLLTLDYDTIFGPEQVEDLIWLAEQTKADAICALQARRATNQVLFCLADEEGGWKKNATLADFEPETVPLKVGHFGLTIIRADAFERVPRPWLHGIPDAQGRWVPNGGCVDPDTAFWMKFDQAGLRLLGAPHVACGHAQMMLTWVGRDGRPLHQYPDDYHRSGVPVGAWR